MITKMVDNWKLNAYYPNAPFYMKCAESKEIGHGMFAPFEAKVPGSVYSALQKAGHIEDVCFELNSLKCEWVKDRWWVYQTEVFLPETLRGRHLRLVLRGIDFKGHVFFNGTSLGASENMYVPFIAEVSELAKLNENNTISVVLEHAPDLDGQLGHTSKTLYQKARFCYKWDFSPRLVHIGLNEPVFIMDYGKYALSHARIQPKMHENRADVFCGLEVFAFDAGEVRAEFILSYNGGEVARAEVHSMMSAGDNLVEASLEVAEPQRWYPNGSGDQPLYTLLVRLLDGSELSDEKSYSVGFRQLEYVRCDGAPDNTLPYSLVINGERVYIKGVNMVPLDVLYGDVTDERYERFVALMREAHVNLVRVWGGGLIEREKFYDLCDRNGIMVWQEFVQSSSGLENVPSEHPAFLKALCETAVEAVKIRRNHVSLTFWSGGNELTEADMKPVGYDNANIALLKKIVETHNPDIMMLPTSASGPLEYLDPQKPGENHDVHGPWQYAGVREQYALYNKSDSLLHSEFGVDGMNPIGCMRRIMSPGHLRVASMRQDSVWRHHGEWWDIYDRDTEIFGRFAPEDLEGFIQCSQFIQAEGLRYALESNRRRAFRNAGSIVWQMNEPWPNASCTSMIDYFFEKKLAYVSLKNAFRTVNPSLKYDKLVYGRGERFSAEVYLSSDVPQFQAAVTVRGASLRGEPFWEKRFEGVSAANASTLMGAVSFIVDFDDGFFLTLEAEGYGEAVQNTYLMLVPDGTGKCSKAAARRYWSLVGADELKGN